MEKLNLTMVQIRESTRNLLLLLPILVNPVISCNAQGTSDTAEPANAVVIKEEFLFEEGSFFAQCHASSLAESKSGILMASWFGGTHEGNKDVVIYGTRYENNRWTDPEVWADGEVSDTERYPCWNPVLFRAREEGRVYLYYNVGPNPREWWGMVKVSDDEGLTWGEARRLPDGILGPIKNRPFELADGTVLSPSSVEVSEDRWIAHVEISDDRQNRWRVSPIDHQSAYNVIQPSILQHADGRLQVLCRSKEGVVTTAWSEDNGESWSALAKTNLINPNSATDAIRVGNVFFIVYNPDIPGKDWWEGRTKLRLAASTDGLEWKDMLQFEDADKGEFSYPTILQTSDGAIHVTYTHNRKNIKHFVLEYAGR